MARRTATQALAQVDVEPRVLFAPRSYERRAIDAWENGADALVTVWHRSAGKDQTAVEVARRSMFGGQKRRPRPGLYFHIFPTFALGRDALWNAGADGRRNLDVFPKEFLARDPNETEMQMRFRVPGGEAIWQIMGADDPDAFRGTRPVAAIFSEFAEQDPEVERVLDPVLSASQGWKMFPYTPKGRNHGFKLWEFARGEQVAGNPRWYADLKTIDDTRKDALGESGGLVIEQAYIDEQRRRGVPEEFIQQEYYCSFDASLVGSYYGDAMRRAERENRITRVPWQPGVPCVTGWDVGYDNYTAIWVGQWVGREFRMLRYLEGRFEHIPYYAKALKELEYVYGEHFLPHDAAHDNIRAPQTIEGQLRGLGIRPTRIVPKVSTVEQGVQLVYPFLKTAVWDEVGTRLGRERLVAYRRKRDPASDNYRQQPAKDEASDAADALRTLAMGLRIPSDRPRVTHATSATVDVYGDQARERRIVAASSTAQW